MRKLLSALCIIGLVVAVGGTAGAGGKGPLVVATSLPAPGFWNGDSPETIKGGFEWALAGELADALGYDGFDLRNVSFGGLVAGKAKGFDVALSQASITKDRKKVVDFSTPYYISDNGIMVNKGAPPIPDVETARGLQWGAQTGSTHVAFLKNELKTDKPPKLFGETTEMFAALKAGQIDAAMTDTSILLAQAGQPGSTFEVPGQFKATAGFYAAIFAKGSKLRKPVNKVIKQLKADGTLDALVQKWLVPEFGADPSKVPYIPL